MGVFENEKRLRKGKKFEEKETRGEKFRRKLEEAKETRDRRKKTDILEIGSSNKPKFDKSLENAIENLKEDSRFPQKPERKKRLGPAPKTRKPKPFRVPGEQKEMIPLKSKGRGRIIDGEFYPAMAKGGRAGFKMGSKCKLAIKGKGRAYGKNS